MMRWVLAGLLCLASLMAQAQVYSWPRFPPGVIINRQALDAPAVTYQGVGDIVSGATGYWGLRAYNAAYATGSNNAINIRRASDNTTENIVILTTGALDVATAATFAGTDATASCSTSGSSTTLNCTSASSTPNTKDQIYGTGISNPTLITSCGTFTGGAGSCTMSTAQNISSAETVTFQVALFVTEVYDQTGNGNNVSQSTAADQLQLLFDCSNTSLPCMYGSDLQYLTLSSASATLGNGSAIVTAERTANTTTDAAILSWGPSGSSAEYISFYSSANEISLKGNVQLTGVNDNASHAIQGVQTGTTGSLIYADGSGASGTSSTSTGSYVGLGARPTGGHPLDGYVTEAGLWNGTTFNTTQIGNLCHNQYEYWGTSVSC